MELPDDKIQRDIRNLFAQVAASSFEADPYLETRVLAKLRGKKSTPLSLEFWKRIAIGSSALSMVLLIGLGVFLLKPSSHPEAFVGEPFAVKLEVRDLQKFAIAKAKIELPDGVNFELEEVPELANQREVTLTWKNQGESHFIPFILKGNEVGQKTVKIVFYDKANNVVAERKLSVRLKSGRG
jgi:hypothetical protein